MESLFGSFPFFPASLALRFARSGERRAPPGPEGSGASGALRIPAARKLSVEFEPRVKTQLGAEESFGQNGWVNDHGCGQHTFRARLLKVLQATKSRHRTTVQKPDSLVSINKEWFQPWFQPWFQIGANEFCSSTARCTVLWIVGHRVL